MLVALYAGNTFNKAVIGVPYASGVTQWMVEIGILILFSASKWHFAASLVQGKVEVGHALMVPFDCSMCNAISGLKQIIVLKYKINLKGIGCDAVSWIRLLNAVSIKFDHQIQNPT
jgi:hypothetical protein